jgi:hypothetical protein
VVNCGSENRNNHEVRTYTRRTPDSLTLLEWGSIVRVSATLNETKEQIEIILKEINYKTAKEIMPSKVLTLKPRQ